MVLLNGADIKDLKVEEAARTVGFLFQNPDNMLFAETVMEEVMFSPTNLGFTDSSRAQHESARGSGPFK